jgi:predicted GNAT family acetyltransferase
VIAEVRDNRAEERFELEADGFIAIAAYHRHGDHITFTHTEVPAQLAGRGVGSRLVKGALEQVRAEGLKVKPVCPFVRHYIETHPEVQDLLA